MRANIPSLLITDDDTVFRETLRGVFEARGYETWLAGDGEEALEIVRNHPVHVAIMDMHMPRLTGLEAIRQVHALNARLPCILLSAEPDAQLQADARKAAVFSFQSKPISRRLIMNLVRDALLTAYDWPWPDPPVSRDG